MWWLVFLLHSCEFQDLREGGAVTGYHESNPQIIVVLCEAMQCRRWIAVFYEEHIAHT